MYLFTETFLSENLRFTHPPHRYGFLPSEIIEALNCSCSPTCYDTEYDLIMSRTQTPRTHLRDNSSYIDIHYGNLGVVKYQRDITFGWTDLLGEFTSICIVEHNFIKFKSDFY